MMKLIATRPAEAVLEAMSSLAARRATGASREIAPAAAALAAAPVLFAAALTLTTALLVAPGCGSLPEVRYYTLAVAPSESETTEALAAADTAMPFLRVERLTVAEPYDGRRIVYRPSRNEVAFWEFHQWAGPPGRMITSKVAEHLLRSGLFEGVDSFPYSWHNADLVLKGAVLAFEEADRGGAWYGHVKLFLELKEPGAAGALWSSKVEVEKKASRRNPQALVKALSDALDEAVTKAEDQMAEVVCARLR